MQQRVSQYIHKHKLLHHQAPVLVALSGGADSVVLLHLLLQLGYTCEAAHCNFHLRGEESNRDEQFVTQLCATLHVPLHLQHFQTQSYAAEHRLSIEMAARELRYTWFEALRKERQCQAIAVAHHQNDQAETLLLHLQRGTGLRGLEGMHPRNGQVVRPLLCTTREAIEDYCRLHRLAYVTDSTNADTTYQRNAIRAHLQDYTTAQIEHIADTCAIMQDYENIVNAYIAHVRNDICSIEPDKCSIHIPTLLQLPAPQTILYELVRSYGFTQTEQIFHALTTQAGKRFYSSDYQAVVDREKLLISSRKTNVSAMPTMRVTLREKQAKEPYPQPKAYEALFDGKIAQKQLTLRHWQEGDWFIPLGMRGKKKLQDFFTDMKIPRTEKDNIWLLCADEEIAWIIGYRIDERYKITSTTQQVAHITIE